MAESQITISKRDIVLTVLDFGGLNTYTIAKEPGDVQINVPESAANLFLDRGVIGTTPDVRLGDEEPITISFTARARDMNATDYATLCDICFRPEGSHVAENWVSTLNGNSDVPTYTLVYTILGAARGRADASMQFPYSRFLGNYADGDNNVLSVSATCFQSRPTFA